MSRLSFRHIGFTAGLLAATLSVVNGVAAAHQFAVTNTSMREGQCLVTASIPCFEGEAPPGVEGWLVCRGGDVVAAQTRTLGKYPDGSARRLLVRFPCRFAKGQRRTCGGRFTRIPPASGSPRNRN